MLQGVNKLCELDSILTEREMQVSKLIFQGYSNQAIANKLELSERTIQNYVRNTYLKLDIHSSRELPKKLYKLNYITIKDFED